jgi:hypothetical protein
VVCAASLYAADFWQSKPFMQWSDKDLHRMIENSPWAKPQSISMGGAELPAGGGRGRRGGAPSTEVTGAAEDPGFGGPGGQSMGGGRNRGGGDTDEMMRQAPPSLNLVVRWQNALPVKQALVRLKYGSETATSPDAKKALESGENVYVIAVTGVARNMLAANPESIKKALIDRTTLAAKGKDELKPTDIQFGRADRSFEVYFVFPKKTEFVVDDKEVEFSTRFENITVKQKFRLKDMLYDGKLAL